MSHAGHALTCAYAHAHIQRRTHTNTHTRTRTHTHTHTHTHTSMHACHMHIQTSSHTLIHTDIEVDTANITVHILHTGILWLASLTRTRIHCIKTLRGYSTTGKNVVYSMLTMLSVGVGGVHYSRSVLFSFHSNNDLLKQMWPEGAQDVKQVITE